MAGFLSFVVIAIALFIALSFVVMFVFESRPVRWFMHRWDNGGRRWFWVAYWCLVLTVIAEQSVLSMGH